jgi:hypothetical protein
MTAALTKGRQQLHYRHRGPGAELRDRHPRELADRPQLVRRAGWALAFAAAAAWMTWAAWPSPAGNFATTAARADVVAVLLVLACRLLGPTTAKINARPSRYSKLLQCNNARTNRQNERD